MKYLKLFEKFEDKEVEIILFHPHSFFIYSIEDKINKYDIPELTLFDGIHVFVSADEIRVSSGYNVPIKNYEEKEKYTIDEFFSNFEEDIFKTYDYVINQLSKINKNKLKYHSNKKNYIELKNLIEGIDEWDLKYEKHKKIKDFNI